MEVEFRYCKNEQWPSRIWHVCYRFRQHRPQILTSFPTLKAHKILYLGRLYAIEGRILQQYPSHIIWNSAYQYLLGRMKQLRGQRYRNKLKTIACLLLIKRWWSHFRSRPSCNNKLKRVAAAVAKIKRREPRKNKRHKIRANFITFLLIQSLMPRTGIHCLLVIVEILWMKNRSYFSQKSSFLSIIIRTRSRSCKLRIIRLKMRAWQMPEISRASRIN